MAMILDAFLSTFSDLLVQMVQEEVGMLLGIPDQIEKLDETVRDIQSVLADAERKQSKGSAIERWLMKLKDVMYDADEVIDLCQIKAKERKERQATSSSRSSLNAHCGCHFLSCFRNPLFSHEIGSKIKDIHLRLEDIAKSKANLGLTILPGTFDQGSRVNTITWRKSYPSVGPADIMGKKIEKDTEMLVKWLTEEESDLNENVRVYGIVGMGGIGKTTLAKSIFNDPTIKEEFQLKIWVCVSKEVKEEEVLKCMIREAGGEHGARKEISELVPLLKSLVQGKKFFFVLDDIWEKSQKVLDNWLHASISGGAHGSRLLVTTRNETVAIRMKASKSHRVEKLSDEDGWSLLLKQVFQNEKESEIEEFKDIGLQLVKKCDGLPLAIKSIGGVLYMKPKTRGEWQAVLRSDVWSKDGLPEDVHRALYLSYEDLSSPLKQCFIFCSLFPEDFEYNTTNIISMWLAEGFLPNKRDFWNLGTEHYTELVLRNLLEETITTLHHVKYFKMHDLLWSFARHLGKNENCVLREVSDAKTEGSHKIRRLSIEGHEVNTGVIKKEKGLRTLLLHHGKPEIGLDDLCKALSNLRILDLSRSNFSILPDSLCHLLHLRYLDIQRSEVTELPNSIGNLQYLVYLNLRYCSNLSHVPETIINLQELKFLILSPNIKTIPAGLKKLDKLVDLHRFKPYQNNLEGFSSLDELETLSNLIFLTLHCLEEVSDMNLAKQAKLLSKDQLRVLTLEYTSLISEEQLSQTNEKKMTTENVLNELCPPLYVESVSIENYFGTHLPNWLNSGAYLPNLKYLMICNCACFEEVASLGLLPNLEYLCFSEAFSVVNIGEEFLLGGIQSRDSTTMSCSVKLAFPKLRDLRFVNMKNWKEWQWNKEQPAMPNLKILVIARCPHLRSLPEGLSHHATSLEFLQIDDADNLITVDNLKVQTMELWDSEMETLPEYLTTIMAQKLKIYGCTKRLLSKIVSQEEIGSERIKFKHIPKVTINTITFLSGTLVDSDHS